VSFMGGGRGLVTFSTAVVVAPWLGFIVSDWLVRTAVAWRSSPPNAPQQMGRHVLHIFTSRGTLRESGAIVCVGALIPVLGAVLSAALFDVRIELVGVYVGSVILVIGFVKLLLLLQIVTGTATLRQAAAIVCVGLAIPIAGLLLGREALDMRIALTSVYAGSVVLVIGFFRLLLTSIRFVAKLVA
jgi:hypothetical protein